MILSIDVGLKNLAMCVMSCEEGAYKIHLWNTYNLVDDDSNINVTCPSLTKKNKVCGKKCNFKFDKDGAIVYTCKSHAPKNDDTLKPINIKKVKDISMQEIAKLVIVKVEDIYDNNKDLFNSIKKIRIELQPKINPKMTFVSHVIYAKFLDILRDNVDIDIKFVRATEKLKAFKDDECSKIECNLKNEYSKRKFLSIQYTLWFLNNKVEDKDRWLQFFESNSKADDAGDTLCYCYNELKPKIKCKGKKKEKLIKQ